MKKKIKLLFVCLLFILTSCKTVEYVEYPIELPTVPDPYVDGVAVVILEGETVSMPIWYYKKIVRYFIDTQALAK